MLTACKSIICFNHSPIITRLLHPTTTITRGEEESVYTPRAASCILKAATLISDRHQSAYRRGNFRDGDTLPSLQHATGTLPEASL